MQNYPNTRSTVKPEPLRIDEYSVWVCTDITTVTELRETADGDGNPVMAETMMYEYHMTRYDKDEYITMMNRQLSENEQQLTDTQLALCELYEGMVR